MDSPRRHNELVGTATTLAVADKENTEAIQITNMKTEEASESVRKTKEFELLIQRDQHNVMNPNYDVPFSSSSDAVGRLLAYHISRDEYRDDMDFQYFDIEFERHAENLLDRSTALFTKYGNLMLKESMREIKTAESAMLERMFVLAEETELMEHRLKATQQTNSSSS